MSKNNAHNNLVDNELINEFNRVMPSFMAHYASLQFKGHRDLYQVFGWVRDIASSLLYATYSTNGIAKAVVDKPNSTTWRDKPVISSSFKVEEALKTLDNRIKIYSKLKVADKLSTIEQYSVIVLCIAGQNNYKSPLSKFRLDDIKKINIYCQHEITPEYEMDVNGNIASIKYYKIGNLRIHPSRVIHLAENSVDGIFGESKIFPIYNQLTDMNKISGSSAEQFYISASLLLNAKADEKFKTRRSDGEKLQNNLYELVNKMKGFLVTSGFEIQNIAPDIVDPKGAWDVHERYISAATNIPRRVLFGSEMGQLASSQDQKNYFENIDSRRENYVNDYIIKQFIDKLMMYSDMPVAPYTIKWNKLSALDDKDTAMSIKYYAESIAKIAEIKNDNGAVDAILKKIKEMAEL